MHKKKYNTIIWDWNGTLLNDAEICLQVMNLLLEAREMPLLDIEKYKEIFTFPVKDYYINAGFDFEKEPFEKPALEFIDHYHKLLPTAKLYDYTVEVLDKLNAAGYNMFILSAMEQESLVKSVTNLGIKPIFKAIVGIDDHFAKSKIQRGKETFKKYNIKAENTLFIGDTLHDKEVATALNCDCILIANGHQNKFRLCINGNKVLSDIKDVPDFIHNK